ncbi:MAG: NifU family protein [Bacteroidia bacterium]|nr:NifU family protein [Bacteroidia bacterium]
MSNMVTIYAEATPNPDSMKFVVSKMILPNDSADFRTREKAEGHSPLAIEIFDKFNFANGVFIMNNFVSITKLPDVQWADYISEIREFIKSYIESGKEIIAKNKALSPEEEGEIESKIIKLLDDHVKPAVEMDGGAISFKSFKDGIVTVVMKGSCSGCPSSTFTLKAGIENLLKRMVPQVEAVEAEAE